MSRSPKPEWHKPAPPHLGQLLHELADNFQQRMLAKCHTRGHRKIRGAHCAVIENLDDMAISLGELAERIGISQQATGKLVRDLERTGYVENDLDSNDKRSRLIRLSAQGSALQREFADILQEVHNEYQAVLGTSGMQILEQQLRTAAQGLVHLQ